MLGSRKGVSTLISLKRTIGQTIDFVNWYQVGYKNNYISTENKSEWENHYPYGQFALNVITELQSIKFNTNNREIILACQGNFHRCKG